MHFSLFCLDSASNKCITSRNQTNPEKIRVRFFAIRHSSYLGAFALEIFFLLLSRFHHRLFLCSLLPLLLLLLSFSCILRCFSVYYLTSEVHTDPITRSARCVCSFALVPPFYDDKKTAEACVRQRSNASASDIEDWISNVQPYASLSAFGRACVCKSVCLCSNVRFLFPVCV